MARRDGTGPLGMGPMTGRGLGLCRMANFVRRSRPRFGFGLGLGSRRGIGRGLGLRRYK